MTDTTTKEHALGCPLDTDHEGFCPPGPECGCGHTSEQHDPVALNCYGCHCLRYQPEGTVAEQAGEWALDSLDDPLVANAAVERPERATWRHLVAACADLPPATGRVLLTVGNLYGTASGFPPADGSPVVDEVDPDQVASMLGVKAESVVATLAKLAGTGWVQPVAVLRGNRAVKVYAFAALGS